MKKYYFVFLFVFAFARCYLMAQADTGFISLTDAKKIKNTNEVIRLELGKEVLKRKTFPSSLKKFIYLENLSLIPKVNNNSTDNKNKLLNGKSILYKTFIYFPKVFRSRFGIFFGDKSRLRRFPLWIKRFNHLKEIDLSGNTKFRYHKQLKKIQNISTLEELTIEPEKIDQQLIRILKQFKHLKELEIKCKFKEPPVELMDELKINLPDVNIIFSIELQ